MAGRSRARSSGSTTTRTSCVRSRRAAAVGRRPDPPRPAAAALAGDPRRREAASCPRPGAAAEHRGRRRLAGRPARRGVSLMAGLDDREHVHAETRPRWRAWLVENHERSRGVWLVSWKSPTGRPSVGYEESVEEALCVGWVDSKGGKIDDERSKLWFAPRNPRSAWARTNKEPGRPARGRGAAAPGRAARRRDGEGERSLGDARRRREPHRAARISPRPSLHVRRSREKWDAFPRSARRGILEWIVQARTEPTRAKRIAETAARAAIGERANEWRPKT